MAFWEIFAFTYDMCKWQLGVSGWKNCISCTVNWSNCNWQHAISPHLTLRGIAELAIQRYSFKGVYSLYISCVPTSFYKTHCHIIAKIYIIVAPSKLQKCRFHTVSKEWRNRQWLQISVWHHACFWWLFINCRNKVLHLTIPLSHRKKKPRSKFVPLTLPNECL